MSPHAGNGLQKGLALGLKGAERGSFGGKKGDGEALRF